MRIEPHLKLEVIWKDEHMFELKVECSNGRYSGVTEVYDTKDSLLSFAKSLNGYPSGGGGELNHECGKRDSYAYFNIRFYQIGLGGIVGIYFRKLVSTFLLHYIFLSGENSIYVPI